MKGAGPFLFLLLCSATSQGLPERSLHQNHDTLAVFVLDALGEALTHSVGLIDEFIAPYTKTSVHIVVSKEQHGNAAEGLGAVRLNNAAVVLNTLEEVEQSLQEGATWKLLPREKSLLEFTLLGLQLFADSLGYTYFLHLRPDTDIREPIPLDIVSAFRAARLHAGVRWADPPATSSPAAIWGLPELLRFFLVTENLLPAGPLLAHCTPPDVEGLHTPVEPSWPLLPEQLELARELGVIATPGAGWRPPCPLDDFVVIDLKFWLSPLVRRLLDLCRISSGARFRWSEAGVHTAVLQALVPEERLHVFNFSSGHARRCYRDS